MRRTNTGLAEPSSSSGNTALAAVNAAKGGYPTLQDKVQSQYVDVVDHGGIPDNGTIDNTAAIIAALNYANGRPVFLLPGYVWRITAPLSGTTAATINLIGAVPAYLPAPPTGLIDSGGSDYGFFDPTVIPWASIIKCDGCDLIGAPDTGSMNAATIPVTISNIIAYGINGSQHGVYVTSGPLEINESTFCLFEKFGIIGRGTYLSHLNSVATIDCGWNLAASGTATYPNTYYSGCGLFLCANITAGDYTTIVGANRSTTFNIDRFFAYNRNHTETTKSGLRAIQCSGLVSGTWRDIGAYIGSFLNISACHLDGLHMENYATAGFVVGDATPYSLYVLNSTLDIGDNFLPNMPSGVDGFYITDTGTSGISGKTTRIVDGEPVVIGASRSSIRQIVTIATPGGIDNYDFKNIADVNNGFNGFVAVSLVRVLNFSTYTRSFFTAATHHAGGSGWQPMTSNQINTDTTANGGYSAVLSLSWNNGDLRVSVLWGVSWASGDSWYLDVGLFGLLPLSG